MSGGARAASGVLLAGLIALAAAGCTAGDSTSSLGESGSVSTSAPASGVPDASSTDGAEAPPLGGVVPDSTPAIPVYTADQLRATIIGSGYGCATWTPTTLEQGVGGRCEESMISALVFPDQTSLEATVQRSTTSATPKPFLVGNRWVMTVDHPDGSGSELVAMQDIIGGSLVGL